MTTLLICLCVFSFIAFIAIWYLFSIILPEKRRMEAEEKQNEKLHKWMQDQQKRLQEQYKQEIREFK